MDKWPRRRRMATLDRGASPAPLANSERSRCQTTGPERSEAPEARSGTHVHAARTLDCVAKRYVEAEGRPPAAHLRIAQSGEMCFGRQSRLLLGILMRAIAVPPA